MKLRIGDQVIVTAGKDKGVKGQVVKVLPAKNEVVVGGANLYTRHVKKQQGRAGEKMRLERPLDAAKVAILNENGEADRIGYKVTGETKVRVYKKTGTVIAGAAKEPSLTAGREKKASTTEKKATKKTLPTVKQAAKKEKKETK